MRKLPLYLFLSLPLLIFFYVPGVRQLSGRVFLLPGVLLLSLGTVLWNCRDMKGLGRIFLFLGCGSVLASPLGTVLGYDTPACGIPVEEVRSFRGYLREDSFVLDDGRTLMSLELKEVEGNNGVSATARGPLVIITGDLRSRSAGKTVEVHAPIRVSWDEKKQVPLWSAYPGSEDILSREYSNKYYTLRHRVRGGLSALLSRLGPSAGLLTALLLGNKDLLSLAERDMFRKAGCSHILALSGMHLGIIVTLLGLLLSRVAGKGVAFGISFLFGLLYLGIAGFTPSLVRAFVMFGLSGVLLSFRLRAQPIEVLGYAFVVLAVVMPGEADSLSFLLSFLALLGIFTLGQRIDQLFQGKVPGIFRTPLSASIGAQWATAFLVFPVFGVLYPVGIIATLLLTPLITLFLWGGLVSMPLLLFSAPSYIIRRIMEFIYLALRSIASLSSKVPGVVLPSKAFLLVAGGLLLFALILYSGPIRIGVKKWKKAILQP